MSGDPTVISSSKILATLQKGLDAFTDQITESQQFMSNSFDKIVDDFRELCNVVRLLRQENVSLKKAVASLETKYASLCVSVHQQEKQLDNCNRDTVSCNAIITGLPMTPHENTSKIVEKTFSVVCPQLSIKQVRHCERIKSANSHNVTPPIRVMFHNAEAKHTFVNAKLQFGRLQACSIARHYGKSDQLISVRNELSALKVELLHDLKNVQQKFRLAYVWPSTGGEVLVKIKKSSAPIRIRTRSDVEKLIQSLSI